MIERVRSFCAIFRIESRWLENAPCGVLKRDHQHRHQAKTSLQFFTDTCQWDHIAVESRFTELP